MKIGTKLPLFIGVVIFLAITIIATFAVFVFRANALKRIAEIESTEVANQKAMLEKFVGTSIDFLQFASVLNRQFSTAGDSSQLDYTYTQNSIHTEENNLTAEAIEFVNLSYNKGNIPFWIIKTAPPYKVLYASYDSDVYDPRQMTISNEAYERVQELIDLTVRVGKSHYEYITTDKLKRRQKKMVYVQTYAAENCIIGAEANLSSIEKDVAIKVRDLNKTTMRLVLQISGVSLIIIAFSTLLVSMQLSSMTHDIQRLSKRIVNINKGYFEAQKSIKRSDELGQLDSALNVFVERSQFYIEFAENTANGNLAFEVQNTDNNDRVRMALLQIQTILKQSKYESEKRSEENRINEWVNNGVANFNDILRKKNDNLEVLADQLLSQLIKYLKANQGGMFIVTDTGDDKEAYLDLLASYAYDHKKFISKRVEIGENLLGACVQEKSTIVMHNIPESYIELTSGLGDAPPTNLMIVPLQADGNVFGALEIASFDPFTDYAVKFTERIAESIAATLSTLRITTHTQRLLEHSRQQAEEMEQKEMELKENIDELRRIFQEAKHKESEVKSLLNAVSAIFPIFRFDLDGYLFDINEVALTVFNYRKRSVVGKHYDMILPYTVESEKKETNFWEQLQRGNSFDQIRFIAVNNREVWLHEHFAAVFDMNDIPTQIVCFAADLTNVKRLEKEVLVLRKEISKLQHTASQ